MTANVRQQRQRETRARLVQAATHVIAERGFSDASVPEIAKAAGLSTGAIYSNFSGKEELFLAAMMDLMQLGVEQREQVMAAGGDPNDLVRDMLEGWVATIEDERETILMLAEFWLYAMRRPAYQPVIGSVLAAIRVNFVQSIRGSVADVDDERAADLAVAIQALAYGHAMQQLSADGAIDGDDFRTAVTWLLKGAGISLDGGAPE